MAALRRRMTLLAVLLLVVSSLGMANAAGREKVTICHIPPGNPGNAHTISVGAPAVPAHLAHGDTLGACADDPNIPPEADAGEDQCVLFGDEATLDGSGSHDPDGGPDPLSYEWTLLDAPDGSTATASDPNAVQPTFTPDRLGDYEFELLVSDGEDDDTDTTVVTSYMDVTLDASVYEMFVTQTVGVEVMIHTAAPEGGAELAIVIVDPELAAASLVDENEVIDSITIEEGETSVLFDLTGLGDGETTLMVGDPTCDGVAEAEVDVEALPLQELAEELEVDEEELAEQLEELLEFDGVTLPDFESSDLWQDVTDALEAIGAALDALFQTLGDV